MVLVLALAPAAFGQQYLTELGPISTVTETNGTFSGGHGFPLYIGDSNGTKLDLAVVLDPVITSNPFSVHTGFGAEGFYFLAAADMPIRGGRALLDLGVEAAYGAEEPMNGDQFLFVRTRMRIDTPVAGTYTVYHPWGQETFEVAVAGEGINFTYDWGGFGPLPDCLNPTPCLPGSEAPGFERILTSPKQGPFLLQVNPAPPEGCIGDGTPATVVGSPIMFTDPVLGTTIAQDFFRVQGPAGSNLSGNGSDFIQTDLFTVWGHIYVPGVDPIKTPNIVCGAAAPPPPPAEETDTVAITRARFNSDKRQLEVRATSSLGLPMTAYWYSGSVLLGEGGLAGGSLKVTVTNGTPDIVRVESKRPDGTIAGSAMANVQIR
ncbi:MAG: hypothetical protein QME75_06905 [Deltaproteobacteria bacterium]|nr:hypothetical protein [Deltaproteobacteria bacterium]